MWIDFDQISDEARLWVYTASRPLTTADVAYINQALPAALGGWAAHGKPLTASARVVEDRFILIAVDETQALPSGCSIDASTHFLQTIGQALDVDFFDRSIVFRAIDGNLKTVPALGIKRAVLAQVIAPDTLIFNNLVKTKGEFSTSWQQPAKASWLGKLFVQTSA